MAKSEHRDYGHRRVVDKLGIKEGHAIAVDYAAFDLDAALLAEIADQAGRPPASSDEVVDVVLLSAGVATDVTAHVQAWRSRLRPDGAIWVLTLKRGRTDYLDQTVLIELGLAAGLVDNKVCSVSDSVSAMRFVVRRCDRPDNRPGS